MHDVRLELARRVDEQIVQVGAMQLNVGRAMLAPVLFRERERLDYLACVVQAKVAPPSRKKVTAQVRSIDAKRYSIHRVTVSGLDEEGRLPKPIKLPSGLTRWRVRDIEMAETFQTREQANG